MRPFYPQSIYRACADMKLFNQEVLRVILLDNESLAHPRDIFRPVITHRLLLLCSCTTIPSGDSAASEADIRLTRRLAEGARILQINMLDHAIVGQSFEIS